MTLTCVFGGLTSNALAIVFTKRFDLLKLSSPKLAELSKKNARSVLKTSRHTIERRDKHYNKDRFFKLSTHNTDYFSDI